MKIIAAIIFLLSFFNVQAQNCKVTAEALSGTYQGECKGNKANGKGTAIGADEYTGQFKNGLPEGQGIYKWKNGNWFEGSFKKGLKEGKGTLHKTTGTDTLQPGFWKNDLYVGLHEKPFVIHDRSSYVSQVDVQRDKEGMQNITLTIESITGGSNTYRGVVPKITITDISVINGTYISEYSQDNMMKTTVTSLRNVQYPFRARIAMGADIMDIEFYEPGSWLVNVKILR